MFRNFRISRFCILRNLGSSEFGNFGNSGSRNFRISRIRDFGIPGLLDFVISRFRDFRIYNFWIWGNFTFQRCHYIVAPPPPYMQCCVDRHIRLAEVLSEKITNQLCILGGRGAADGRAEKHYILEPGSLIQNINEPTLHSRGMGGQRNRNTKTRYEHFGPNIKPHVFRSRNYFFCNRRI